MTNDSWKIYAINRDNHLFSKRQNISFEFFLYMYVRYIYLSNVIKKFRKSSHRCSTSSLAGAHYLSCLMSQTIWCMTHAQYVTRSVCVVKTSTPTFKNFAIFIVILRWLLPQLLAISKNAKLVFTTCKINGCRRVVIFFLNPQTDEQHG